MVAALNGHLDWLAATYAQPWNCRLPRDISTSKDFAMLAERLEKLPKVRCCWAPSDTAAAIPRASRAIRVDRASRPNWSARPYT